MNVFAVAESPKQSVCYVD